MDRWIHDVLGTDFEREIGKLGEFPSSFSFPKGDIIETNSDVQIILDVPGKNSTAILFICMKKILLTCPFFMYV